MSSSFESSSDDEENEDDDDDEESDGEDEDDNDSDYVAPQQPLLVPAKATCTCLRALDDLHICDARPNLTAFVSNCREMICAQIVDAFAGSSGKIITNAPRSKLALSSSSLAQKMVTR